MPDRKKILGLEEQHRAERSTRFGRSRKLLKYLPRRGNVDRYPVVRWFAEAARARPFLWSFRVPAVRRALYVGAVVAFLPIYGLQVIVAFWAALVFRANLGVSLALQVITNPLSAAPAYYLTYRVGMWLVTALSLGEGHPTLGSRINALVLGGVVVGLAVGLLLDIALRVILWEAAVLRKRHQRSREAADAVRAAAATSTSTSPSDAPTDP